MKAVLWIRIQIGFKETFLIFTVTIFCKKSTGRIRNLPLPIKKEKSFIRYGTGTYKKCTGMSSFYKPVTSKSEFLLLHVRYRYNI